MIVRYFLIFIAQLFNYEGLSKDKQINLQECEIGISPIWDVKFDTTSLKRGRYSLTVISKYIQQDKNQRPVYLNQNIRLEYNDSLIYDKPHKSIIKTQIINGKSLNFLENFIIEIGIVEGVEESIFYIQGYGGCNSCTEYHELFDRSGQSIYLLYYDKSKVYSEKGSLKQIYKRYRISEEVYRKHKFVKKDIVIGMKK